jgi:hypothetical protein
MPLTGVEMQRREACEESSQQFSRWRLGDDGAGGGIVGCMVVAAPAVSFRDASRPMSREPSPKSNPILSQRLSEDDVTMTMRSDDRFIVRGFDQTNSGAAIFSYMIRDANAPRAVIDDILFIAVVKLVCATRTL